MLVMRETETVTKWEFIGGVNMKRLSGNVFDLFVMLVMRETETVAKWEFIGGVNMKIEWECV